MKTYEKPKLIALSICGNEMLCSCAVDADNDPVLQQILQDLVPELNPFGTDGGCDIEIKDYCKFTGANLVFSS